MKTFPALYIDTNGVVRYIPECPEEPPVSISIYQDMARVNRYERELTAAKQSSIEVVDNIAIDKLPFETYDRLKDMEIVRLPDGWGVEVRTPEIYHEGKGYFWERRAVLIPPSEKQSNTVEESQEVDWSEKVEFIKTAFQLYVGFATTAELEQFLKESKFTIQRKP